MKPQNLPQALQAPSQPAKSSAEAEPGAAAAAAAAKIALRAPASCGRGHEDGFCWGVSGFRDG